MLACRGHKPIKGPFVNRIERGVSLLDTGVSIGTLLLFKVHSVMFTSQKTNPNIEDFYMYEYC